MIGTINPYSSLRRATTSVALERSENAYSRLVRGLLTPGRLLLEKVGLAAGCAAVVTLIMAALVSSFVHLDLARFPLWLVSSSFSSVSLSQPDCALSRSACTFHTRRYW